MVELKYEHPGSRLALMTSALLLALKNLIQYNLVSLWSSAMASNVFGITAEVEFLKEDAPTEVPDELKPASVVLGKVIQSFKEQGAAVGKELPFHKPYRFNECGWVANRWCELLQLSPGQKQFFLEQENPRLRLDLVNELLEEMGVYKAVK